MMTGAPKTFLDGISQGRLEAVDQLLRRADEIDRLELDSMIAGELRIQARYIAMGFEPASHLNPEAG